MQGILKIRRGLIPFPLNMKQYINKEEIQIYDFLIVGAGLAGAVLAHELKKKGYKVIVVEKRENVGGNCMTSDLNRIIIHEYGPHIFHTKK